MNRTYGAIERAGEAWIIPDLEPHVRLKLKAIFPRVPRTQAPPYRLAGTTQVDADLKWFMQRYPLQISESDRRVLDQRTTLFEVEQSELAKLLAKDWKPSAIVGFRDGERPYDYQAQAAELCRRKGRLLLMDDLGLGKAQPLTSCILTPTGWIAMGSARVGQKIIGRDGRTHSITGVFPQGMKPAYRVTFSDGAVAECCDEHLWTVRDQNRRLRGKGWAVKPLKDIVRQGVLNKSGTPKWEVPLVEAVEFPSGSLPIPAYVMGVLLGDGYLNGPTVTFSVPPAKEPIRQRVIDIVGASRVTGPHGNEACPQWNIVGDGHGNNPYRRALAQMQVDVPSTRRFVPHQYLHAGASDRMELLRGLMDTDGGAQHGRVTFHTCSPQLAVDVVYLVRSLGGVARAREYDRASELKPTEWQVCIRIEECPFSLPYKMAGCPAASTYSRPRRYIRSVEAVGDKAQQCIAVDAPDHLYVTDNFIVTHNTVSAIATFAEQEMLPALVVPQTHLVSQWEEKIAEFTHLTTHVITGTRPYALPKADVYICPYSRLGAWIDYAETQDFTTVVFDEIQELRNGTGTSKGKAAQAFRNRASVVLGLSATPIFNYGAEIFAIIDILEPGALGSLQDFTTEWCTMGNGGKWLVGDPAALGTFLREQHLALRRTAADVGRELKPVNTITHESAYDAEVIAEDAALIRDLAIKVTTSGSFVEKGQAAREFDIRMRHATGMAKAFHVAAFVRMLLESGRPVVLFGWHRDVYDVWMEKLADFRPRLYTGSESTKQKDEAKRAFIAGETNLLILSLRSGAGLDGLQHRCHTVVYGELDWSPKVHEQCTGRVQRPGQTEQVDAIFLIADGGSDPAVVNVLGVKASQSHGIVDPLKAPVDQVSDTARIRDLAMAYLSRLEERGQVAQIAPPAPVNVPLSPVDDEADLFSFASESAE